ncbi:MULTISPECIES: HupE/UreJ family protein [Streptomyces]|uniref:HupE/UreJ family protein n=1 Tax=Streptomyces TaxID=1883 RepID=UPI000AF2266F|nr:MULTISPECIES: HupE/UreJ family protein [Streptomyces]MDI5913233.1 HupE/UreJ family protein [Streptomyces sp. 12257]
MPDSAHPADEGAGHGLARRERATIRYDFDRGILKTVDAETPGVFDYETKSLSVPADEGSWLRGLAATTAVGIEHVSEGADHLLFLLMLLIPAPLVATGSRWQVAPSRRRAITRILHVVTAFAVGHSLTLALAATGVIALPTRLVETLIALSIAVSAIHAIRPLAARGEVVIATGFGLIHGLAFASLITDLGLDRGSLLTTLLGFNLGIELTQLLVVALLMPSLLVLARRRLYPAFRTAVAVIGLVFSVSWMLERAALTPTDPFESVQTWLVRHPRWVAVTVAGLAAAAHGVGARAREAAAEQ